MNAPIAATSADHAPKALLDAGAFETPTLGGLSAAAAQSVRAAPQRLRELLWRDLEHGCAFAHLASTQRHGAAAAASTPSAVTSAAAAAAAASSGTVSDDSHWASRRSHVFALLVSLGEPLLGYAAAPPPLGAAASGHVEEALAEALARPLQGVLRTYRHFLALELAPRGFARPPFSPYVRPHFSHMSEIEFPQKRTVT